MALLYVFAGTVHLIYPDFYLRIMPLWLPWHILLVFTSGMIEILLGVLLLFTSIRRLSAWLIIIMLIVFFCMIHIPMTIDYSQNHRAYTWLIWLRLPVQFLLIAWAYSYAKKN